MFVHTVIMVIEPHMKQGRQHKLISTIFLATSVTKKLDHNICFGSTSLILGSRGFNPVMRYLYWSSVSSAASWIFLGQDNLPSSNLLYKSRNPVPIHKSPLHRSERFPQNRNRVPFSNGFCPYRSPMIVARPSIPFLRSTVPHARTTRRIPAASSSMGHLP